MSERRGGKEKDFGVKINCREFMKHRCCWPHLFLFLIIVEIVFVGESSAQSASQRAKKVESRQMPAEQTRPSVEGLRDRLLKDGAVLTDEISNAVNAARNIQLTVVEILLRSRLRSMEQVHLDLSKKILSYDRDVSNFLVTVNTMRGVNLNTQFIIAIYTSQVSNQREIIRTLLSDLRGILTSLRSDLNNKVSLFLSVFVLVLVIVQIRLMIRQDRMMKDQLKIAMRQDETARLLFARKASLELTINGNKRAVTVRGRERGNIFEYGLKFSVFNSGDKSVKGIYNHILIPAELQPVSGSSYLGNLSKSGESKIEGTKCSNYKNYVEEPVFPTRSLEIGTLSFKGPPGAYKILWQIAAEDGAFPDSSSFGEIILTTEIEANKAQGDRPKESQ